MEHSTKKFFFYAILIAFHLLGTIRLASAHFLLQETVVTGHVTSSIDGTSLPGVNIIVKGTIRGTTTDADGRYRINVSGDDILGEIFKVVTGGEIW